MHYSIDLTPLNTGNNFKVYHTLNIRRFNSGNASKCVIKITIARKVKYGKIYFLESDMNYCSW